MWDSEGWSETSSIHSRSSLDHHRHHTGYQAVTNLRPAQWNAHGPSPIHTAQSSNLSLLLPPRQPYSVSGSSSSAPSSTTALTSLYPECPTPREEERNALYTPVSESPTDSSLDSALRGQEMNVAPKTMKNNRLSRFFSRSSKSKTLDLVRPSHPDNTDEPKRPSLWRMSKSLGRSGREALVDERRQREKLRRTVSEWQKGSTS
ncbi:hypothetical protein BT69DRAFT_1283416 [Atractiella rhizophila]|nr:hypothetical protein BT69DRAFT_1283416 [Atractiella rhizophila]